MEQTAVYTSGPATPGGWGLDLTQANIFGPLADGSIPVSKPIKAFLSPGDPASETTYTVSNSWWGGSMQATAANAPVALANYWPNARVFCARGSLPDNGPITGINWTAAVGGKTTMTSITDGTSNTVFYVEKLRFCGPLKTVDGNGGPSATATWTTTTTLGIMTRVNGGVTDWWTMPAVHKEIAGKDAAGIALYDPPLPKLGLAEYPKQYVWFNQLDRGVSLWSGGCLVAMGDGSVRGVTSTVNQRAWTAAVTPAGGEVANLD